ncbi:hypothetical protein I352_03140 [Cryptococcus deuterogattii MMRL2647]|nr:hypothetical protein I352_03140 [Cryptococcus deuterogattii MMRL2647]
MRIPHRRGVSRKSSQGQPREKKRQLLSGEEVPDVATTTTVRYESVNTLQSKEGTGQVGESMANIIVASASATKEESESLSPLISGATTRATTADVQATAPLNTATTISRALTSNGQLGSTVTSMTSSILSSKGSSIIANLRITGSEKGDRSTSSLASAAMSTRSETVTAAVPATSLISAVHPIQVNTFPSDFPVETQTTALVASAGRGYVFLPNDAFADSRGVKKDLVIREEMRWAEGREILERKIIWQGEDGRGDERKRLEDQNLKKDCPEKRELVGYVALSDRFSSTYRDRYNWKNASEAPCAVRHASKEGQGEEQDHSTPNLALNPEFRLFPPIIPLLGSPPTLLVALEVES